MAINAAKLKLLTPFNEMTNEQHFQDVIENARVLKFGKGKIIFKRGDEDQSVYWLLAGSIDMLDEKFTIRKRNAGEDAALLPIDNNSPHRLTVVSTTDSSILKIDRSVIGFWSPGNLKSDSANFEVIEYEQATDWMSELLRSPLFELIPPSNIQTLFSKFEKIKFTTGETVIHQGEVGDSFFVMQQGRAKIERTAGGDTELLAEISAGDSFGQDALVSDMPRNATVTMLTDGTLMRLSGPDFESLLMSPVIENLTLTEAMEMVEAEDPVTYILDVRSPGELESGSIQGSLNVPFLLLRKYLPRLKPEAVYVTACDSGKRAEIAAYILTENGFSAYAMSFGSPIIRSHSLLPTEEPEKESNWTVQR